QAVRAGARCSIIDPRRVDHRWADGLDGVEVWRSAAEITEGLAGLEADWARLADLADLYQTDQPAGDRCRLVVIDDLTVVVCKVGLASPATRALRVLVECGRQVEVQVIAAGGHLPSWVTDQACTRIAAIPGRKGWVRVVDDRGEREAQVVYM